ncbi:MAG: CpsD/CapB family tyrosine-protein kinase [Clostridia bacterium]|nr:CpsD/CapB family tyrosine-protein kinase [Clostridia bacterium]
MRLTADIKSKIKSGHSVSSRFVKDSCTKLLGDTTPFAVQEAYKVIRTRLSFTSKGEKCPIYVITSSSPGEGKTLTSLNIAISFSEIGKKVLLIDGDMRNPTCHKFLDTRRENGLSELLAGISETVNVRKTKYDNLFFMAAGSIPPNPAELLASSKMNDLIHFLKEHFDYILMDTPPIGIVTDASLLSDAATGFIIVAKSNASRVPEVQAAVGAIRAVGGRICGFVLNGIGGKGSEYYKSGNSYGYSYYYGKDAELIISKDK